MIERIDGTPVASHTEYVRTRTQCVRCGMRVRTAEGGRLCGGCRSAD
jgi:hypothetical protein